MELFREQYPMTFKELYQLECGEGWFPLILEAAKEIEPILAEFPPRDRPSSLRIKEKYGLLRWHWTHYYPEIDVIVDEAIDKSEFVCERCGKPGRLRGQDKIWFYVACNEHAY